MTTLLELKEKLTRFYGKYDIYITPVIKFTVALTAFLLINHNIGYMEKISSTPIALILALICSILPVGGAVFIGSVLILLDMYALSLEVCIVALILFILMYILYFRFSPKNEYGGAFDTDLFWTEHSVCDAGRHGTFAGIIFHVFSGLRYRSLFLLKRCKAE